MKTLNELALQVAAVLPVEDLPDSQAPSWIKTTAIVGVIIFVAGIIMMWVGLSLLAKSKKGDLSGAARTSAVGGIGLVWLVLGATGGAIGIISSTVAFVSK